MSKPLFKDLLDHKILIPLAFSDHYEIDRKVFDHYKIKAAQLNEWDQFDYVGNSEVFKRNLLR